MVGNDEGAFLSTNCGTLWQKVSQGLVYTEVYSFGFVPTPSGKPHVFAGTWGGGVWERPMLDMVTSTGGVAENSPREFVLEQNYPNPFNPVTSIGFRVAGSRVSGEKNGSGGWGLGSSNVKLAVYDMLGREVAVLVNEKKEPGSYEVKFDAANLSSGVYFYRLQVSPLGSATGRDSKSGAGDFVQTRKLLVLR